ncbi:MAG: YcjF family protein [Candidatus Sericytochromatia bacterium]
MSLPTPVSELWNVWREIEGNVRRTVMVNLLGPAGESRDAVKALFLERSSRPGSMRVLELSGEAPPEADLHLILVDAAFGPTSSQSAALRRINPKDMMAIMVGVGEEQAESRRREVAVAIGVRAEQVVTASSLSDLRAHLPKRMIHLFDEHAVPLARQFPFLREESANQELNATSQQNAMVGVIPVPGADMPIMTANQIKMVLRLAAIYDQPMTFDRAKEVMAVVGGGLALRTAARQVAKFIPGPGWIVGGVLGYGGTLAMGKAAIEYFKRGTEPAESRQKPRQDPAKTVIDAEAEVVEDERAR